MSKALKEYEVIFANLNLGCVGERIFRAANAEQAVEMAWRRSTMKMTISQWY